MKTWLLILVILTVCFCNKAVAQEQSLLTEDIKSLTTEELIRYYHLASAEEKLVIDSLFSEFVERKKAEQITSICGVPFGMSSIEAKRILRNKFGEPHYMSEDNSLVFHDIKYAGIDFDFLYFLFQSDGYNSFLSGCVFVKNAKDKSNAIKITELYRQILSKKYELAEAINSNGFKCYGGGVSPLWKGGWYDLVTDLSDGRYLSAILIDVIEYNEDAIKYFGNKYGVRIIYGPFQYVEEEF